MTAGLEKLVAATGASGLCVHHWLVTAELVSVAHSLNLKVGAWTVDRETDAWRVKLAGVDFITSTVPERLRTALEKPVALAGVRAPGRRAVRERRLR